MLFILETLLKMHMYDKDEDGRKISIVIKYEWSLSGKKRTSSNKKNNKVNKKDNKACLLWITLIHMG